MTTRATKWHATEITPFKGLRLTTEKRQPGITTVQYTGGGYDAVTFIQGEPIHTRDMANPPDEIHGKPFAHVSVDVAGQRSNVFILPDGTEIGTTHPDHRRIIQHYAGQFKANVSHRT